MKFVVKRSQLNNYRLYNQCSEKRSILGFLGQANNIPDKFMKDISHPSTISNSYNYVWPQGILNYGKNSNITERILYIQFNYHIYHQYERENKITDLFNELNIEILFED